MKTRCTENYEPEHIVAFSNGLHYAPYDVNPSQAWGWFPPRTTLAQWERIAEEMQAHNNSGHSYVGVNIFFGDDYVDDEPLIMFAFHWESATRDRHYKAQAIDRAGHVVELEPEAGEWDEDGQCISFEVLPNK